MTAGRVSMASFIPCLAPPFTAVVVSCPRRRVKVQAKASPRRTGPRRPALRPTPTTHHARETSGEGLTPLTTDALTV